jgi:hypothetical protein
MYLTQRECFVLNSPLERNKPKSDPNPSHFFVRLCHLRRFLLSCCGIGNAVDLIPACTGRFRAQGVKFPAYSSWLPFINWCSVIQGSERRCQRGESNFTICRKMTETKRP